MERLAGIEPVYSAWEANILPLNHRRLIKNPFDRVYISLGWWTLRGSNSRPPLRQSGALPAELSVHVVPTIGIEPTTY